MKGSIKKRSEGSWSLVFDLPPGPDGQRRQKRVTVRGTKQAAQAELNRLLVELQAGTFVEPNKLTVGQYLEKWLEYTKGRVKARSYRCYAYACETHIIPALGPIPLTRLTPLQIEEFLHKDLASGRRQGGEGPLSRNTVGRHFMVLSSALRQAVLWQLLARNPCDVVERPRAEDREYAVADAAGLRRLLEALEGHWLQLPVFLAACTGLRRGEVLGLKWGDLDLERGTLSVRRQRVQGAKEEAPKTERARRTIALPAIAVAALRQEQEVQELRRLELGALYRSEGWVIAHEDGAPIGPDYLTQAFRRKLRRLGLPMMRFHDLRHSSATLALTNGVDVRTVAGRLGHADSAITLRVYAHFLKEADQAAAEALNAILPPLAPRE
jgi:integrase